MTRSTDFRVTVSRGVRAAQRDLVVHSLAPRALGDADSNTEDAPKVGLVVGKSVGNAVQRHRVSRQLRHASRDLLPELQGRLPIRVELKPLDKDDFRRILTEPEANLIRQHQALLATEGVTLAF